MILHRNKKSCVLEGYCFVYLSRQWLLQINMNPFYSGAVVPLSSYNIHLSCGNNKKVFLISDDKI